MIPTTPDLAAERIELLPCPFCSCRRVYDRLYIRDGSKVACLGCGASTHGFNPDGNVKAIAAWNRRAALTPAPTPPSSRAVQDVLAELYDGLTGLERAATEVARYGAKTGGQWPRLSAALIRARTAIAEIERIDRADVKKDTSHD